MKTPDTPFQVLNAPSRQPKQQVSTNINYRCFVAMQFLLQIYAFFWRTIYWPKNAVAYKKWQIWGMSNITMLKWSWVRKKRRVVLAYLVLKQCKLGGRHKWTIIAIPKYYFVEKIYDWSSNTKVLFCGKNTFVWSSNTKVVVLARWELHRWAAHVGLSARCYLLHCYHCHCFCGITMVLFWYYHGTSLVLPWFHWVEKHVNTMQRHRWVCLTLTRCYLLHCYHSHCCHQHCLTSWYHLHCYQCYLVSSWSSVASHQVANNRLKGSV